MAYSFLVKNHFQCCHSDWKRLRKREAGGVNTECYEVLQIWIKKISKNEIRKMLPEDFFFLFELAYEFQSLWGTHIKLHSY